MREKHEEIVAKFEKWWEQWKPPQGLYTPEQELGVMTCSRHAFLYGYAEALNKLNEIHL